MSEDRKKKIWGPNPVVPKLFVELGAKVIINKMDYEELFSKMIKKYPRQMFPGKIIRDRAKESYYLWSLEFTELKGRFIVKLNLHVSP